MHILDHENPKRWWTRTCLLNQCISTLSPTVSLSLQVPPPPSLSPPLFSCLLLPSLNSLLLRCVFSTFYSVQSHFKCRLDCVFISGYALLKINNSKEKKKTISLKKQVMDQCILPTMTYGCQTWSLNKQMTMMTLSFNICFTCTGCCHWILLSEIGTWN